MKKELVMWLIIAVLVVGLLLGTQKAETMAIDFGNTFAHAKSVTFANPSGAVGLTQKSISMWFILNALPGVQDVVLFQLDNGTGGWVLRSNGGGTNAVYFYEWFSGTNGVWNQNTALSTTGIVYHLVITYDNSSVANNAVFYLNGIDDTSAGIQHPTGTKDSETSANLAIGNNQYNNAGYPLKILDFRIYNRILTPAEVLQMYNARGRDNIRNGLVFCPFLKGAAGLQAFDGATLAAGNTIVDPCSGAVGVPAGNPVGVGETYLR